MDDLVPVTKKIDVMNKFKSYLASKFKMTDLKNIKLFLGIRIIRENDKISLDQTSCINKILRKLNMNESKHNKTPLVEKVNF